MARLIAGVEPARADHGDECVTLRNLKFELLGEVDAGLHSIDVHKQLAARIS